MDDHFYGDVTLPDGRVVRAIVYGRNDPAPDGFEIREHDPLSITWVDGSELSEADFELVFEVKGNRLTLEEFVIDQLIDHGKFEGWEMDEDNFLSVTPP